MTGLHKTSLQPDPEFIPFFIATPGSSETLLSITDNVARSRSIAHLHFLFFLQSFQIHPHHPGGVFMLLLHMRINKLPSSFKAWFILLKMCEEKVVFYTYCSVEHGVLPQIRTDFCTDSHVCVFTMCKRYNFIDYAKT